MKLRYFIIFGVIAILFIWFALYIKNLGDETIKQMRDDPQRDTTYISPDYNRLFKDTGKLIFINTVKSKYRNPISEFKVGDDLFVEVYKLDSLSKIQFSNDFVFTTADIPISYDVVYRSGFGGEQLNIRYKSGTPDRISKLHFNLFGLNTKNLIQNDSVAYFYSNFKSFLIKFDKDLPQDVFGEPLDEKHQPIEVLFLKKRKALYFILLSTKAGGKIKPGTLLKLINLL
ncbi:hypothetical protein [Mucilaginibacter gilvus]|uniref:Uncharacterized protein n=1 Tax=Mucilaginibacter gilvus TaxID=2305909 RepID=A0A3S3WAS1_9SPHI|nr:hypothetical protein [Mucilaginibacter gilvus]RWY52430.1 hypothetical protein EPL05_11015 [Mucilaginibacter gilvus]